MLGRVRVEHVTLGRDQHEETRSHIPLSLHEHVAGRASAHRRRVPTSKRAGGRGNRRSQPLPQPPLPRGIQANSGYGRRGRVRRISDKIARSPRRHELVQPRAESRTDVVLSSAPGRRSCRRTAGMRSTSWRSKRAAVRRLRCHWARSLRRCRRRSTGRRRRAWLLGFYVVECASLDEAIETAKELGRASSSLGSYEIRPLRLFDQGTLPR